MYLAKQPQRVVELAKVERSTVAQKYDDIRSGEAGGIRISSLPGSRGYVQEKPKEELVSLAALLDG